MQENIGIPELFRSIAYIMRPINQDYQFQFLILGYLRGSSLDYYRRDPCGYIGVILYGRTTNKI